MDADLVGLGLGLGLCLAVAGTGLGASNAGRGNALASSRGGRRGGRGRGTPSGFRASSSLGGARDGGRPSRFNQVLLRSVVWFGGATERHYHNKGNGAGRAPAEAGGPLFRKHWLAAFGRALRRSQLQSQVAVASRSGCCCCFGRGSFFFCPCAAALRALPSEPSPGKQERRGSSSPTPAQRAAGTPDQTRPDQAEASKARRGKARQGEAKQGRAGQHDSKQGPGWLLSLSCHSLAPRWLSLGGRSERSATGGIWTGSCVYEREA